MSEYTVEREKSTIDNAVETASHVPGSLTLNELNAISDKGLVVSGGGEMFTVKDITMLNAVGSKPITADTHIMYPGASQNGYISMHNNVIPTSVAPGDSYTFNRFVSPSMIVIDTTNQVEEITGDAIHIPSSDSTLYIIAYGDFTIKFVAGDR